MVDLIVQRHGGNKPGDDIIDPLIATDAVAIARGRNELDARARAKQPVQYESLIRAGIQPGQMAEFHDALQGTSYRGKITRVEYRNGLPKNRAILAVEKVSSFQ